MRDSHFPYLPRDFIQTQDRLIFAVVSYCPQNEKIGCFLRYIPAKNGWQKIDTTRANQLLERYYPHYCYYSEEFDATFHGVPTDRVAIHYQPEKKLRDVLQYQPASYIEKKLHKLVAILVHYGVCQKTLGVTGSILIDQQRTGSDIDLVIYGRVAFHQARQAIRLAIADARLTELDLALMRQHYARRQADISFDEFAWHEKRKLNKAVIDGCKFDLGMVCLADEMLLNNDLYQKQGKATVRARVIDDTNAFDFPSGYCVDDGLLPDILSFTHTYVGQAKVGELIEAVGAVECSQTTGARRLIIGSTREAKGEYIKVVKESSPH